MITAPRWVWRRGTARKAAPAPLAGGVQFGLGMSAKPPLSVAAALDALAALVAAVGLTALPRPAAADPAAEGSAGSAAAPAAERAATPATAPSAAPSAAPAAAPAAAPSSAPSAAPSSRQAPRLSARSAAHPRVQIAAALLGGSVSLSGAEHEAPDGTGQGLSLTAAYFPLQRLGVVAEVERQWAEFPMCHADGACYTDRAETQTLFTAGVRLPFATSRSSALALDATAGVAASETGYVGRLWSPVFAGTLSWRMELGPMEAGVMARASTTTQREHELTVTTLAVGLLAGKSW